MSGARSSVDVGCGRKSHTEVTFRSETRHGFRGTLERGWRGVFIPTLVGDVGGRAGTYGRCRGVRGRFWARGERLDWRGRYPAVPRGLLEPAGLKTLDPGAPDH